ncbi:unnamed protein product [Onchocerca flexuosa]|uniref:Uncharacterized protein n=1 Tax=Onchocerca flexuosa TaxID=387005 RepID=A0A183HME4_9BILA|nr:unnamed protein product [Onchocerca flexuosa]
MRPIDDRQEWSISGVREGIGESQAGSFSGGKRSPRGECPSRNPNPNPRPLANFPLPLHHLAAAALVPHNLPSSFTPASPPPLPPLTQHLITCTHPSKTALPS